MIWPSLGNTKAEGDYAALGLFVIPDIQNIGHSNLMTLMGQRPLLFLRPMGL
jgi:hypothetical protein